MLRSLILLLLVCVAVPAGVRADKIEPADPQLGRKVEFYQDVFPILEAKCLACHNVRTKEGSLSLETVQSLMAGGDSGDAIVAGKPDESLVYLLASRADVPEMPPLPNSAQASPLTPRELGILRQWIQEGASPGTPPPPSDVNWLPVPDHIQSVLALALDPANRFVAAGRANRVVIFDLASQQQVAQLTDPALLSIQHEGAPMYGPGATHRDFVHSLAFSPSGDILATGGYRVIKLWQRERDRRLAEWDAGQPIQSLAVSSDGTLAATGQADGSIRLWNLTTVQPGATLTGHSGTVTGLAFSEDGTRLFSGGADKTLRSWNVEDGSVSGVVTTPAEVTAAIVSRDGSLIASGHQDHVIRVWDVKALESSAGAEAAGEEDAAAAPQPVRELKGHSQPVTAFAGVPGKDEILSASLDGTVRLWNITNGQQVRSFNAGTPVRDVAISPDGQRVACSAENGSVRLWRADNAQQLAEVKGDPSLAVQVIDLTDELTVAKAKTAMNDAAFKEAEKDVTGREESLTKAQEQKTEADKALAEAEAKFKEADAKATEAQKALEEKPDDEGLKKGAEAATKARTDADEALKKARMGVESAERAVRLSQESLERVKQLVATAKQAHEAAQAYEKQTEEKLNAAKESSGKSAQPVHAVAFSPDGGQLLTAGAAGRLDVWNGHTGGVREWLTIDGEVQQLAMTGSGSLVTVQGNRMTVRDSRPRWTLVARLGASSENPLDVSTSPIVDRVLALDFSPDGTKLVSGGGEPSRSGELLIWDVASRSVARALEEPHSDTVFDAEFSRDGKLLVSGAADKFVKLFSTESGELIRSFEGHTNHVLAVSIKADESSLVSAGADHAIKLWDLRTGEQRRTMSNYSKQVTAIDYVGVTDNFISCGGDKTVRLFTASNGSNIRTFGGNTDYVYAAVASGDQNLVISGGEDGVIRVWNGQNGQELMKFEPAAPAGEPTTTAN